MKPKAFKDIALSLLNNPKHKVIKIKDKIKISGMNLYKLIIILWLRKYSYLSFQIKVLDKFLKAL